MNDNFSLNKNMVHLWSVTLSEFSKEAHDLTSLLSEDETHRSNRFHFPLHRQRFLVARGLLRKTLALYTETSPEDILFSYGPHGKPYLENNPHHLEFNVSHSHDVAIFALSINNPIGVDIEKIELGFKENIAKRFFSQDEYTKLMQIPVEERTPIFYRLWARKEAVIKALGTGLFTDLSHFSVSLENDTASIILNHNQEKNNYFVQNVLIHPGYQSALASHKPIKKIIHWKWTIGKKSLCVPKRFP